MKKIILAIVVVGLFLVSTVDAQPQGAGSQQGPMMQQKGQQGMMMGEGQMQMMPMCMSMIKGMTGQGMMMRDMMQTMKDMMAIQEKVIKGVKPAEKKALLEELSRMQGRMDQMMVEMRQMMMHGMPGTKPVGAPAKTPQPAPHH